MSNGHRRRPQQITQEEMEVNWDRIFNKKQENTDGTTSRVYKWFCPPLRQQTCLKNLPKVID